MEYVLWSYFIIYPAYIYLNHNKEKQAVLERPSRRVSIYLQTIAMLWIPVLVLLLMEKNTDITLQELGLIWHWNTVNTLALIALGLFAGYLLMTLRHLKHNTDNHDDISAQISYVHWLMPATNKEVKLFILGVSVSAGICEELLFRGYLMHVMSDVLPTYAVVILSSIIFGLPHIYQGTSHVLRTTVMGVILAIVYLVTDSLLVPIFLHIMIDMYGGALAYIINSSKQKQS